VARITYCVTTTEMVTRTGNVASLTAKQLCDDVLAALALAAICDMICPALYQYVKYGCKSTTDYSIVD